MRTTLQRRHELGQRGRRILCGVLCGVLCAAMVTGCSVKEVQTWFALRGHPSMSAARARDIADKVNAKTTAACDANYADFCVPNNQTEVHCVGTDGGGPPVGRTRVVGWDHFGLDPDGDKVACDAPPRTPAPAPVAPPAAEPAPPVAAPPVTAPPVTAPTTTTSTSTTTTTTTTAPPTTTTTPPPVQAGTSFAYVAATNLGAIRKIDTVTLQVVATYDVGGPLGPTLAMSGSRIYYLTTTPNRDLSIGYFDTATNQNHRTFISGASGSLLRTSPALPNRLFIGATGVSPGSIRMYDTSGPTGVQIAATQHTALGGNLQDFGISADGTRLWTAAGGQYEITEVRTSDLEVTGKRFPTGPYPTAVTTTTAAGTELIAAGGSSNTNTYVFDAADPADVTPTALGGATAQRGLEFSHDGSRLYTVVETSPTTSELVTMTPRTDVLLRTPFLSASLLMGDLGVDPGTGRVFVAANNSVVVYNPDGTLGRVLTEAAPRSVVFSATSPTSNPPRLNPSPGDSGPPSINSFTASRPNGASPLSTAFQWFISDPDPGSLTCSLDLNDDGRYETTIASCTNASMRAATFDREGTPVVRLRVSDGHSVASRTVTLNVGPQSADLFEITVRPSPSMTASQQSAFSWATSYWEAMIRTGLPDLSLTVGVDECVEGAPAFAGTVDDVLIEAIVTPIDGPGGVLGSAGPCIVRATSGLPAYGVMMFDAADVAELESSGLFNTVVTHEMGHVLGFGSGPNWESLVTGAGSADPRFTGTVARAEWSALGGSGNVPVENEGGPGTANSHWRESVFGNEIMTGYLNPGTNPFSRVTAGALSDMGYGVDLDKAWGYTIAGLIERAALRAMSRATPLPDIGDMELLAPIGRS